MGGRRLLAFVVALIAAASASAVAAPAQPTSAWLPDNPFMSDSGANSMHGDSYASDSHPFAGPVGKDPQVTFSGK